MDDNLKMDLLQHVKTLAGDIGPRGSATEGEAAAAIYVEAELKKHLMWVETEPFRSFTSFSWPYLVVFSIPLLAAIALWWLPVIGLVLGLAGAAIYVLENNQAIELGNLFPQHPSRNVVARLDPQGPVASDIVFAAHLDTQRAADNFKPGAVRSFRASFLAMTVSAFIVPLLALLSMVFAGRVWALISVAPAAILAFALFSLVSREVRHGYTPGANDDASGLAIMLELARHFARDPLRESRLWFVATGCEEVGSTGMKAFLSRHSGELVNPAFVILDNVGAGNPGFTKYEGMLKHYHSDRALFATAVRIAADNPMLSVSAGAQALMPTDATQVIIHGHRAIAILAYDATGLLPNWHWYTDVIENLDPDTMSRAFEFVRLLAEALDH